MTNIYLQYSNCIPVKGYNRSAIYDIQRVRYTLIDNNFADLLIRYNNKLPLDHTTADYKDYIDELTADEWGQYINKKIAKLFPPINLEWKHPAKITNAVVDFIYDHSYVNNFFQNILPQFEELTCKNFEIHFLKPICYTDLLSFLASFDDTLVNSLVIFLPYISITEVESSQLFALQPRLIALYYYSCPTSTLSIEKNQNSFYTEKDLSLRNENEISPDYFVTNILLFTESQQHNTYYNRKLSIDAEGNIKNSPEHSKNYGNVMNTKLSEALNHKDFKEFWFVNKDIIDVCRDCEFRHMCVDSCIPKQRKDGTWYRSKECNYNPYISKWKHEKGYKSLKECGVEVIEMNLQINEERLVAINQEIWAEK